MITLQSFLQSFPYYNIPAISIRQQHCRLTTRFVGMYFMYVCVCTLCMCVGMYFMYVCYQQFNIIVRCCQVVSIISNIGLTDG